MTLYQKLDPATENKYLKNTSLNKTIDLSNLGENPG